ncbi:hypothetical protein L596_007684 [Steinernema carpocapsae]|uniref:G-protein coupled receptors family 1 profile domain-containing protein n=1 Tax=Steinernema carpocapsae TaxID=34508 RepID=A0A4U5PA63_STECR|nr:hypothetical protein L596_007684 [Steinernema carpocapsae]
MAALDESVAVSSFRIFVWVAAVVGNSLIIYLVLSQRSLRRKGANLLFAQLALADFIAGTESGVRGVSVILFDVFAFHDYTKRLCLLMAIPGLLGIHMSQSTMLMIAIDRLLCIKLPIFYRNLEGGRFAVLRFLLCVGFSITMTGVAFVGIDERGDEKITVCSAGRSFSAWYTEYWVYLACFFTLFIYVIYIAIYILFTRQTNSSFGKSSIQKAIFFTMTAVLIAYFVLWCVPNTLFVIFKHLGMPQTVLGYNSSLIGLCSGVNSAANVLIYSWKHPELRAHMKMLLTGKKPTMFTASHLRSSIHIPATTITHA